MLYQKFSLLFKKFPMLYQKFKLLYQKFKLLYQKFPMFYQKFPMFYQKFPIFYQNIPMIREHNDYQKFPMFYLKFPIFYQKVPNVLSKYSNKGWFTLDAAVCVYRSGLRQRKDRKFSISLRKRNHLPQTHAENAEMWMTLKPGSH